MARVDPERIRNVALLGHSHDGKTSLAEAMLYAGGAVDRLGRPDAGNTTFDFEPEEIKRKISIGTAIAHVTWHDHKINLLDTPGFQEVDLVVNRKSTRLNSSHSQISYAVFCLKKKKNQHLNTSTKPRPISP